MRGRCSGGTPGPVSETETWALPSSARPETVTVPPVRRVAHRVVQEGGEYLTRARRVAANGELSRERDLEPDALGGRPLEETLGGLTRDDGEVEGLLLDLQPAGVEAREQQEVGEQRVHAVYLGELVFHDLPVVRGGGVAPDLLGVDLH